MTLFTRPLTENLRSTTELLTSRRNRRTLADTYPADSCKLWAWKTLQKGDQRALAQCDQWSFQAGYGH